MQVLLVGLPPALPVCWPIWAGKSQDGLPPGKLQWLEHDPIVARLFLPGFCSLLAKCQVPTNKNARIKYNLGAHNNLRFGLTKKTTSLEPFPTSLQKESVLKRREVQTPGPASIASSQHCLGLSIMIISFLILVEFTGGDIQ